MNLYDDVVVKATKKRATIVDEGTADGRHYFIVEPEDEDDISCYWDEELAEIE